MGCNCKNTITNFLGGDVANPTTFLNCGEADGTYNNPVATDITQCVAIDNVLRVLDTYYISGSVKNSGQIVFERTVTGETVTNDTNIANSDLTLDGNHITDVSSYQLLFDSGSTEVLKIRGTGVTIGPSGDDYIMPVIRGTANYILQTNGSGAATWVASSSTSSGHYWSANTNVDYAGSISNSGFTSVGIGTEYPEHKLTVSGNIGTDAFLYHNGDDDTYVKFQSNEINLVAGGNSALKYTTTDGKILLNNTNANIDLHVMGDDGSIILQTDATNNRVGINRTPREALDVTGGVAVSTTVSAHTLDLTQSSGSIKLPHNGTITAENSGGVARTILYNIGDTGVIFGDTNTVTTKVQGVTVELEGEILLDGNVTADNNINVSGNTNIIGALSANTVSGDTVIVGPAATAYTLPTVRGTNRYVLQTDGAGATAWVASACCDTRSFVERFQVYDEARTDGNYKYPVSMTTTGRMAKVNVDYGSASIDTTTIPRATVLKSAYFVIPSECTLEKIVGWGEFGSSNTITIDVCKFSFTNDEATALAPTSIGQATYAGGSDIQKSKSFATTGIGAELSQGDVIMPMVKAGGLSSGSYELAAFFTLEFKFA